MAAMVATERLRRLLPADVLAVCTLPLPVHCCDSARVSHCAVPDRAPRRAPAVHANDSGDHWIAGMSLPSLALPPSLL